MLNWMNLDCKRVRERLCIARSAVEYRLLEFMFDEGIEEEYRQTSADLSFFDHQFMPTVGEEIKTKRKVEQMVDIDNEKNWSPAGINNIKRCLLARVDAAKGMSNNALAKALTDCSFFVTVVMPLVNTKACIMEIMESRLNEPVEWDTVDLDALQSRLERDVELSSAAHKENPCDDTAQKRWDALSALNYFNHVFMPTVGRHILVTRRMSEIMHRVLPDLLD